MDLEGLIEGRRAFSEARWIDVLCLDNGERLNAEKWELVRRFRRALSGEAGRSSV